MSEDRTPCWEMVSAACDGLPGVNSMVGYRALDISDGSHLGMPSSLLTFIVSGDDGVEAALDAAQLALARPQRVILGGLHVRARHVRQHRGQTGVQLAVHPLASRALFGVPAASLSVSDFDGSAVLGAGSAAELSDRVAEATSWQQGFAVVADHLRREAATAGRDAVRPEVRHAWAVMQRYGGRVPVASVATEVGLTQRHLSTLFHREVGLAPKAVARLMRFQTATVRISRSIVRDGRVNLAAVAASTGFFDQAHLSTEFVAFTGRPPRKWIAEEFQNIQDGGHQMADPGNHDPFESGRLANTASP